MWIVLCCFATMLSTANLLVFQGQYTSTCQAYDDASPYNITQFHPSATVISNGITTVTPQSGVSPYAYDTYEVQCSTYNSAYIAGIVGSTFGGVAVLLSLADTVLNVDHDTFLVRSRRAFMFGFAFCFIFANMLVAIGSTTPDCDLNNDGLDDILSHDDTALQNNCRGKSTAIFFYAMSISCAAIASIVSLRFNFPLDGAAVSYRDGKFDESFKINSFASDERHSVNRVLSRDVPVASTLFRFKSYFYQEDKDMDDRLLTTDNRSNLGERLLG